MSNLTIKFFFLFLIITGVSILKAQTTYYIDATGGNDSNSGLTPQTPWQTLNKANNFNYNTTSGNIYVKLKRGEIWRETLRPYKGGSGENNRIIFSSYGTGRRPQILGSNNLKGNASQWSESGTNIWRRSLNSNPYYVIFEKPNIATNWGYRQSSSTACNSDYKFNYSSGYLYVYSVGNPETYYERIEEPARAFAVGEITVQYITLDSLEIWGSQEACVRTSNGHFLTIQNCDIHHVGNVSVGDGGEGDLLYIVSSYAVVRNNKIWEPGSHGIYQGMYNGLVGRNCIYEGNYIANCYYTMIDIQHTGSAGSTYGDAGGHIIRNNYLIGDSMAQGRIYNGAGAGIQVLGMRENGKNEWMKNVKIYNNVLIGMQWGINWTRIADSIHVYNNTIIDTDVLMRESREDGWPSVNGYYTSPTRIWWKNNIVYRSSGSLISISNDTNKVFDNNVWYSGSTNSFSCGGISRNFNQWKSWIKGDNNSVFANPMFVHYTNKSSVKDLRLLTNSPAVDIGANLGVPYNYDILGISRPQGNAYDAGAYELVSGSGGDITPPTLLGLQIINPTTLELTFSEGLEQTSAQTIGNYSISNEITVSSAILVSSSVVRLTTSQHQPNLNYIVVVSNVMDLAGNIISSNNTATYSFVGDSTPPELLSAEAMDSIHVYLIFSEALQSQGAQNNSNYSITNGITINLAVLSSDGKKVTLTTSVHQNGNYTITVNNIRDIVGNIISSDHNSASYNFSSSQNLSKLPVINSSASTSEPEHTPEKTLDGLGYYSGNPHTRWAGQYLPQWIAYDFGELQILTLTKLSFYCWNEGRVYTYSVLASIDSVNWEPVITDVASKNEEWSVEMIDSVEARYIRVLFLTNDQSEWAGLWEVEFYGHPANIISVELASFTSSFSSGKVNLEWITASETSNYGFEIQRRTENTNYEKIGFVSGHGNSTNRITYNYVDQDIHNDKLYYRLKQIDLNGDFRYSAEIIVITNLSEFKLNQNYPNPFNPQTTIQIWLPEKASIKLCIFNPLGEIVAELANGDFEKGGHDFNFNATGLSSGVYFYRIESEKFNSIKKMMYLK